MQKSDFDLDQLAQKWPSAIVAREEISNFTGGTISPRTLANKDSLGEGPPRINVGRKVCYPVDSLIKWMKSRQGA